MTAKAGHPNVKNVHSNKPFFAQRIVPLLYIRSGKQHNRITVENSTKAKARWANPAHRRPRTRLNKATCIITYYWRFYYKISIVEYNFGVM